jgi:hypothetical protein
MFAINNLERVFGCLEFRSFLDFMVQTDLV